MKIAVSCHCLRCSSTAGFSTFSTVSQPGGFTLGSATSTSVSCVGESIVQAILCAVCVCVCVWWWCAKRNGDQKVALM